MKPFIRKKLPYILIIVQTVLILGILFYIVPGRYRLYDIVLYDESEYVPSNPLIGYAPRAENLEDCENTNLVFILLSFSEWEPREGEFDIASLEKKYHVAEHRNSGRHAVLRFVCDQPSKTSHRDIPLWLYEKTRDGLAYVDASGSGYSPDYANPVFLAEHGKALQTLAEWCRKDDFVAYVEIGSVGQNGNWEAFPSSTAALVPSAELLQQYGAQYADAFPKESGIRLLGSAGAEAAVTAAMSTENSTETEALSDAAAAVGIGSWDDVLGDAASSAVWSSRINSSGELPAGSDQSKGTENRTQTKEDKKKKQHEEGTGQSLWAQEPVGGGMTTEVSMSELLMDRLSDTLTQIRSCHISFIGPECPNASQQRSNGSEMILRDVGYCIYLSRLQTTVDYIDDDLLFHFTFVNTGNAPMYWDWPVTMYVYDRKKNLIREQTLDLKLSSLLPGEEKTVTGSIPYSKDLLKGYRVCISIKNPEGTEHISLAQKGVLPNAEGIHRVYQYSGPSR